MRTHYPAPPHMVVSLSFELGVIIMGIIMGRSRDERTVGRRGCIVIAGCVALSACANTTGAEDWRANRQPLELGVHWDEGGSRTSYDELQYASDFAHRVASEQYGGKGIVFVTRDYDITEVGDDEPEQVLRLDTGADQEVLSTWDGLRRCGAAMSDGPSGSTAGPYRVFLEFPAVISDAPVPGNGILELESSTTALDVSWEMPARVAEGGDAEDGELSRTVEFDQPAD